MNVYEILGSKAYARDINYLVCCTSKVAFCIPLQK